MKNSPVRFQRSKRLQAQKAKEQEAQKEEAPLPPIPPPDTGFLESLANAAVAVPMAEQCLSELPMSSTEASQEVPEWLEDCAHRSMGTGFGMGGRFASRDVRGKRVEEILNTLLPWKNEIQDRDLWNLGYVLEVWMTEEYDRDRAWEVLGLESFQMTKEEYNWLIRPY